MNLEVDVIAKYVEKLLGALPRQARLNWADAPDSRCSGTHVLWTDLIGNVAALATVLLAMRKSIWTWPVQFTGSVLLLIASVNAHITGNALKQAHVRRAWPSTAGGRWRRGTPGRRRSWPCGPPPGASGRAART